MMKSLFDLLRFALLCGIAWMVLSGWGIAAGRLLRIRWSVHTAREEQLITGLFCLFLWGGLWNFWLPFNLLGAAVFAAVGGIFYAFREREQPETPPRWQLVPVLLLFLTFAMGETQVGDSLSYHCDTIRWINDYAAVPGLANLHSRLGFNQFYFYWPAFCEAWLPGLGWSCANPFLGMAAASYFYQSSQVKDTRYPAALALGGIIAYSFRGFLASPAPDPASTFLQILFLTAFVRQLEERQSGRFPFFVLFAVTLVLTKLANAVMTGTALLILFCLEKEKGRALLYSAAPALLLTGVWMARSVILSGYFVYPLTWPSLNTAWRLPAARAAEEQLAITGWARLPGEAYRTAAAGSWSRWLGTWCRVRGGEMAVELFLMVSVAGGWLAAGNKKRGRFLLTALLPVITGLIFWFVTAPDPRFVRGILLAAVIIPAGELLKNLRYGCRTFWVSAGAALFLFLPYPPSGNSLRHTLSGGAAPRPLVGVEMVRCPSGLWVTVTGKDASPVRLARPPLPATPQLDPRLSLRGKTLQEGFFLDATAKSAEDKFLPDSQKRSNR